MSDEVEPFTAPPTFINGLKKSSLWFFDPSNITCSKRWAKPVRPWSSSFDPTWYQMLTAAIGREWSSCRMTCSPLGSVYLSKAIEIIGRISVRVESGARPYL